MYPTIYDVLIQVVSSFAFFLNLVIFFVLHSQLHKRESNKFFVIIKWGRLLECVTPFIIGPYSGLKLTFPVVGGAFSGVCHQFNGIMTCKYGILMALVTAFPIVSYISFCYLIRYNSFVRNKPLYYTNYYEKFGLILIAIVVPIVVLVFFKDAGYSKEQYLDIYPNKTVLLQDYDESHYTLVLFQTKKFNSFSYVFFGIGLLLVLNICQGFFYYYFCLDKKLRQCLREAKFGTAEKIRRSIFTLRLLLFFPIVFAFTPIFVPLALGFANVLPEIQIFLGSNSLLIVLVYFIVSPLFALYQVLKSPKIISPMSTKLNNVVPKVVRERFNK